MKGQIILAILLTAGCFAYAQDNWLQVHSNLNPGLGIGQISVGMNDQMALWARAINNQGQHADKFTRSVDGGLTWTQGSFNAGTGLSMLFAIDASTCWAVFNNGASQGLYKTDNGGITWIKKGTAFGEGSFADVVHFFNESEGMAMGDPRDGYFEIYTTSDGGENWIRIQEANIPDPMNATEYGTAGNYDAFENTVWFGTNKGRIFRSTDKGQTWQVFETAFSSSTVVNCRFKDAVNGIAFRSYADLGLESLINVTTDGGETWTSVSVQENMYGRYFEYIPGTANTYISSSSAFGESGISYSTDGGYSWITLTQGFPFQAMAWLDYQTGIAGTWAEALRSSGGMYIYDGTPITGEFPEIAVTPGNYELSVISGESSMEMLTITNTGTLDLNYVVGIVYDFGVNGRSVTETGSKQTVSLTYGESGERSGKSERTPARNFADTMLHYDGDPFEGRLFNGWPVNVQIGAMFPSAIIGPYTGMELTTVDVFIQTTVAITQTRIRIYGMETANNPGELLHAQPFIADDGWNSVVLTDPVLLNGEDIWITYQYLELDSVYSASTDDGLNPNPNGRWQQVRTGPWQKSSLSNNYNIRGTLTGMPVEQWLIPDRVEGTIEPGGSDIINLTFDASMLPEGNHSATIIIQSDDPENNQVEIPVILTVDPAPYFPPVNLTAFADCNDVILSWDEPSGEQELIYDSGLPTGGYTYEGYTLSTRMSPLGPCQLLEVKYYTTISDEGDINFNSHLFEWTGTQPGTEAIYTQEGLTGLNNGWVVLDLSAENITFEGDFVVGFGSVTGAVYLGYDETFNNDRSWDFNNSDLSWSPWIEAYFIRATVLYPDGSNQMLSAGSTSLPEGYNVYRDAVRINPDLITLTSFTEENVNAGSYAYSVRAVYDQGISDQAGPVPVVISEILPVSQLIIESEPGTDDVFMTWSAPPFDLEEKSSFAGYHVWRNNELLTETPTPETFFMDMNLVNGTYDYCVTANYGEECESEPTCGEASVIISVGMDQADNSYISIFPNPSRGLVNIETTFQIKSFSVLNQTGQVVINNNLGNASNLLTVSTSSLEPGIYILILEAEEGSFIRMIAVD